LLQDVELSLREVYYPLGFRLNLVTNSREVLAAAAESWGVYAGPEFPAPPLSIRVIVREEGGVTSAPVYRAQGPLLAIISDAHNLAVYDARTMSGFCIVSAGTAADHLAFRFHYLEGMVYSLLAHRYLVPLHAACIARDGAGVLLCGPSGAGKSTLAYGCARAGWTYVADDCTWMLPDAGAREAIGRAHMIRFREDAPALFPELGPYAVGTRPNGKLTMEVPLADFPEIRTSRRCEISRMVILDRRPGGARALERMASEELVEQLLADIPSYGEEVNAVFERTLRRLAEVPAYRMRYELLDDAVELLEQV
jgi:hypothetical protein